jgi:hypothetical protein
MTEKKGPCGRCWCFATTKNKRRRRQTLTHPDWVLLPLYFLVVVDTYIFIYIYFLGWEEMPVYLCLAGAEADEPWKHGIQVFAKPFAVPEPPAAVTTLTTTTLPLDRTVGTSEPIHLVQQPNHHGMIHQDLVAATAAAAGNNSNHSIRKVMHAQVVLVDDVCMAYGRYWVRLRWPGSKGGFAGYIAMHQIPAQLTPDNNDGLAAAAATDEKDHPPICKLFWPFFIMLLLLHAMMVNCGTPSNRFFSLSSLCIFVFCFSSWQTRSTATAQHWRKMVTMMYWKNPVP